MTRMREQHQEEVCSFEVATEQTKAERGYATKEKIADLGEAELTRPAGTQVKETKKASKVKLAKNDP